MSKSKTQKREDKIKYLALLKERNRRSASKHLLSFVKYTFPDFELTEFHEVYYELLDRFAHGKIKKLIITVGPQHGKSEGSTRRLPAFMFGLNPNKKIAIGSYNATFARKFNRDVQRIVDDEVYHSVFPNTTLNNSNVVTVSSSYLRNSDEFEIVGHTGSLKAVGRGGPLTGNTVDVIIMDDLYKDYAEGNSPIIRDAVWDWYTSVVKTRLHNHSQELIVFTRWHEDDLIGRLEKKEQIITITSMDDLNNIPSGAWVKINFESIKESEKTEIDKRDKGVALWSERHSIEKLQEVRSLDPENFNCLYQGNPISREGLLYGDFKTYSELPQMRIIKNYTDTADTGNDYLCSIVYGEPLSDTDNHKYIIDILYTQDPMETTEGATIELLNRNGVHQADVESNNGGRGFARVIERGSDASINWFHQSKNKESRIYSNSAKVNREVVFPDDWHIRWAEFYNHVTSYKKVFKANKHDDCADALTGIVEPRSKEFFIV